MAEIFAQSLRKARLIATTGASSTGVIIEAIDAALP